MQGAIEAAPRLQRETVFLQQLLFSRDEWDESAAAGASLGGTIFRTFLLDYPSLEGL